MFSVESSSLLDFGIASPVSLMKILISLPSFLAPKVILPAFGVRVMAAWT